MLTLFCSLFNLHLWRSSKSKGLFLQVQWIEKYFRWVHPKMDILISFCFWTSLHKTNDREVFGLFWETRDICGFSFRLLERLLVVDFRNNIFKLNIRLRCVLVAEAIIISKPRNVFVWPSKINQQPSVLWCVNICWGLSKKPALPQG